MGLGQEQERLPSTGPLTMPRAAVLQVPAELWGPGTAVGSRHSCGVSGVLAELWGAGTAVGYWQSCRVPAELWGTGRAVGCRGAAPPPPPRLRRIQSLTSGGEGGICWAELPRYKQHFPFTGTHWEPGRAHGGRGQPLLPPHALGQPGLPGQSRGKGSTCVSYGSTSLLQSSLLYSAVLCKLLAKIKYNECC